MNSTSQPLTVQYNNTYFENKISTESRERNSTIITSRDDNNVNFTTNIKVNNHYDQSSTAPNQSFEVAKVNITNGLNL